MRGGLDDGCKYTWYIQKATYVHIYIYVRQWRTKLMMLTEVYTSLNYRSTYVVLLYHKRLHAEICMRKHFSFVDKSTYSTTEQSYKLVSDKLLNLRFGRTPNVRPKNRTPKSRTLAEPEPYVIVNTDYLYHSQSTDATSTLFILLYL